MPTDFDRFFLNLPPFDRERDFDDFWKKAFQDLKRVPIEPTYDLSSRRSTQRFDLYEVTFRGYNKSRVTGEILYPKGARRAKFAVCLHDYNRPLAYQQAYLDIDLAYFFIRLRGHELIEKRATDQEPSSPGYLVDGILELDNYYAKGVYLDAFRAIDVLRLNSKFDSSEIGMMGKGFGAAAAVFATSFSDRVSALVIDTLAFCCLPVSQNSSTSDATNEINAFWLLENDLVEAIIALPTEIFFRTGIGTYLWILSNKKTENRRERVQLINAADQWVPIKNEGNKRRIISEEQIHRIAEIYATAETDELSHMLDYRVFGYRRIRVLRPLRMLLHINKTTMENLEAEKVWAKLTGEQKEVLRAELGAHLDTIKPFAWAKQFIEHVAQLSPAVRKAGKSYVKALVSAFGVRDADGEPVLDEDGEIVFDPDLTDYENVPLTENVKDYFAREVLPHVPDAYIDKTFLG